MNSPSASCTACAAFCSACSLSRISSSSGSRSCVGCRSKTSRCWYAATGASANSSRRDRLLQVDDEAHDARLVLADANAGDVRVVGAHLADQLAQLRAELEAVDVDDEAGRARRRGSGVRCSGGVGLDRHARVVGRRPDAHRRRSLRPRRSRARRAAARASPCAPAPARREVMAAAPARSRCSASKRAARVAAVARNDRDAQVARRAAGRPPSRAIRRASAPGGEDVAKSGVLPFLRDRRSGRSRSARSRIRHASAPARYGSISV